LKKNKKKKKRKNEPKKEEKNKENSLDHPRTGTHPILMMKHSGLGTRCENKTQAELVFKKRRKRTHTHTTNQIKSKQKHVGFG
jgi:hypothetical protein